MIAHLFKLLQLLPAFRKLLTEHFDAERAELQAQVKSWQDTWRDTQRDCLRLDREHTAAREDANKLAIQSANLLKRLAERDAEIERLRNATTEKLKAADVLPADAVWDAPVRGPKRPPAS